MSINNIKDYYYILGVSKSASKDEIKKAYRKLSLKLHPDQNNGDKFFEARFRDVNEAYETLIDDAKRKWYDGKLSAINNENTGGRNYSSGSSQNQQSKKQQEPRQPNTSSRKPSPSKTSQKQKSNKALYTAITILLFASPFVIKIVIDKLNKEGTAKNYSDPVQYHNADSGQYQIPQNSSYDTTALLIKNTDTTSQVVSAPGPSGASPPISDTGYSGTSSQNANSQPPEFRDEDGLTATDALNYFLQALNNNDCNAAWNMTYNATWESNGKDWFCSSQAFGGVKKVAIKSMYPVMQSAETEIYVDYYAEDIYNGNKCFKQNITLQKIAFTDKTRWKVTKMKNVEDPVECNGN